MVSKLSKQGILKGYVDSYCLVCESYFKCPTILDGHVLNPTHKNNLNSAGYVEKYKDNYIRKVKKGYFCEFCNALLPTAAKTNVHIEDPKHIARKGAMLLKRDGNKVVAFENIIIRDKAWNGLVDDTCFVCNAEFEDEEMHKRETSHKLNLVQCKTEFGTWGTIYRKIDDDSFHCLPCNKVYSMMTVATHFDTNEHKEKCLKGCTKTDNVPITNTKSKTTVDIKQLLEPKVPHQEPLKKRVIRRVGNLNINRPFIIRTITQDYEDYVVTVLKATSYLVRKEYDKMWCIVCEWQMDTQPALNHLNESHHKALVNLHKTRLDRYTRAELAAEQQIIDAIDKFENNNVNIDVTVGTAVCQICFKSICYVYEHIDRHIKEHKQQAKTDRIVPKKSNTKKAVQRKGNRAFESNKYNEIGEKKNVIVLPPPETTTVGNKIDEPKQEIEPVPDVTETTKNVNAKTHDSRSQIKKEEFVREVSRSSSVTSVNDPETIEWAAENKITFDHINKIAFCNICNSKLPMWLKNIKEHVAGNTHRKLLTKYINNELVKPKKPKNFKVATKIYIKSFILVETLFSQHFIINNKVMINYKSMCFLKKTHGDFLKCALCNIDVVDTPYAIEAHRTIKRHSDAQQDALVITSLDSEFVRETEFSEYHCGFCNHMEKDWADLTKHLTTTEHKESRTAAAWRLQEYTAKW